MNSTTLIVPLNPTDLLAVLIGTTLALSLSRSWRLALLALLIHYVALGGLVLDLGPIPRAGLRILTGCLVCLVLFFTARRLDADPSASGWLTVDRRRISGFVFRLAAAGLVGIAVFGASLPGRFPSLPAELVLAAAWLMGIGLVIAVESRELWWVGLGLLVLASGFETLFTGLDPRLVTAGLLSAAGLLLALLVAVVATVADRRKSLTRPGK